MTLVSRGGYTLVHKHVYRVFCTVLGLQFACTCYPNLVHAFLACMCASCTRLVHTLELCMVGLMSPILCAHAGLHVCEMKNVLCHALAACVFFKLSCTIHGENDLTSHKNDLTSHVLDNMILTPAVLVNNRPRIQHKITMACSL